MTNGQPPLPLVLDTHTHSTINRDNTQGFITTNQTSHSNQTKHKHKKYTFSTAPSLRDATVSQLEDLSPAANGRGSPLHLPSLSGHPFSVMKFYAGVCRYLLFILPNCSSSGIVIGWFRDFTRHCMNLPTEPNHNTNSVSRATRDRGASR